MRVMSAMSVVLRRNDDSSVVNGARVRGWFACTWLELTIDVCLLGDNVFATDDIILWYLFFPLAEFIIGYYIPIGLSDVRKIIAIQRSCWKIFCHVLFVHWQRAMNLTKVKIIIHTENSRRFSIFYYIVYILNENYLLP